ncbi:MAG: RDD family protein [Acidobacteria bacterium]|nr:RDD family protein [Acidobacteriota bacterium]
MSGNAGGEGDLRPTDRDEQDFQTALKAARRSANVDEHPALTEDEQEAVGEEAGGVAEHVLEQDDEAWETPVPSARVPAAAKAVVPGVPRRLAAALLDAGASLVAAGLALLVSELLWLRSDGAVSVPVWVPALVFFGAGWAHTLAGEGVLGGVTLGKRALGLCVVGGGGQAPALWRVAARRACLDAVALVVVALALWLTMVRQYGGLPPGSPVDLDVSDVTVFCAFFVNLLVLLALARRFDPKRRFPHDSLAGLAVICDSAADAGAGAASRPGGRRVAAPVGAVPARWNDETAEVAPARPWDGRKWSPDPAAAARAAERERARMGPVSRLVERVVAWGQGSAPVPSVKADETVAREALPRSGGSSRCLALVNRLADRVVAWSEGETGPLPRAAGEDSAE